MEDDSLRAEHHLLFKDLTIIRGIRETGQVVLNLGRISKYGHKSRPMPKYGHVKVLVLTHHIPR